MAGYHKHGVLWILTAYIIGTSKAVDNSSTSPFAFKTFVVGVHVSTKNFRNVYGLIGMESNFRDVIFSSMLLSEHTNETLVSNITLLPIEIDFDSDAIGMINGLVSVADCEATYKLNSRVTSLYGVVFHIAITEPGCPRLPSETAITVPLSMFRPRDEVLQLLVDMRKVNAMPGWTDAIIIHDKFTGNDILLSVEDALGSKGQNVPEVQYFTWSVDSRHPHRSFELQIEELFQSAQKKDTKFIIITPVANIESTLSIAKRMNLLKYTTQWLFIAPDSASKAYNRWDYIRDKILVDGTHLAFVSNRTQGIGSFSQLFCTLEQLLTILTETIEVLASEEFNEYVQVSDDEWDNIRQTRQEAIATILQNSTDNMQDIIQSACDNSYQPQWILEAAENGRQGKRIFQVGNWEPLTGLELDDDLFPHIVGKFRGRRIKIASMHFPPWQIFARNASTGKQMYSGLIFEILNHMGHTLNFTYQVVEPSDGGSWGEEAFDGTWNGMMKQVINEEVILGAAAFTIRPEKSKVVNFTTTIEREAYTFMVNRPSELSRVLLFAEPFRLEVWACIAVSIGVVGLIFYKIQMASPYYEHHKKKNAYGLFCLRNCYLYVYGALLQQGGSRLPESMSGRTLIGFWWIFVLVTITTYAANLVAFLTFPRVELPVNSISDLVNYRGVQSWGFVAGSVIESYLKSSNNSDIVKLNREAIKHPIMNSSVLNRIRFHEHAYIDWKISLNMIMKESYLANGKCEFVLGKEEIFQEQIAMVVPRSSPYLQMFNEEIKTMLRSGMMIKWRDKYWPKKDKCSSMIAVASANRTVKIGDMQGSFYILSFGLFISASVLLIEYLWNRRQKTKVVDAIKRIVHLDRRPSRVDDVIDHKPLQFLN